jgi:hypothetical protein
LSTENPRAANVRSCIQAKFYGVYTLLKLRAIKVYGTKLEDLLAGKHLEVVKVIENLIGDRETLTLILRECLEEKCLEERAEVARRIEKQTPTHHISEAAPHPNIFLGGLQLETSTSLRSR